MKNCPSCGARYEDAAKFCQHDGTLLRTAVEEVSEKDPYVGQVLLGQFEIREVIGEGGMGRVYRAQQHGFDRQVAIKILHTDLITNQEMVKRFNREAKIISRLDHPCIIHVYLFGELPDGNLYLAMEYVDGAGLTSLIDDGPVAIADTVHIGRQILSALTEAHRKGVVHRDLKPDNIMLVAKPDEPLGVKVLDFGIAKFLGSRTMLTQQGLVFGSARYISPEAAAGETVDERADLYAVGVILYQMLAGRPPFDDASAVSLLMRHVNDPAPELMKQPGAKGVPESLAQVVMQSLEKDPAHRFDGAAAMRTALTEAAKAGGVLIASADEQLPGASWSPPSKTASSTLAGGGEFRTDPMFGAISVPPNSSTEGQSAEGQGPSAKETERPSLEPTKSDMPTIRPRATVPVLETSSPSEPPTDDADESDERTSGPPADFIDPNDDEIVLPRSRAWIVLVVIAILAIAGGALGALLALDPEPVGEEQAPDGGGPATIAAGLDGPSEPPAPPVIADAALPAVADASPNVAQRLTPLPPSETRRPSTSPATSTLLPNTPPADAPTTPPQRPATSPDDSGNMPPAVTLSLEPRRPRTGQNVRLLAKVSPASKLTSPRFVISRKGAEPTWRAAKAAAGGVYAASHTFSKAGSYQVTFVATSDQGEVRAFSDAIVSAPRRTQRPTKRPTKTPSGLRPLPTDSDDKPPDHEEGPPTLLEPWTAPVSPW